MARDVQREGRATTPERFAQTTPPAYPSASYDFALQAVMEMQKTLGALTQAVTTLTEESKKQRDKIDKMSHTIYAATVVLIITIAVGGWFAKIASDVFVQRILPQQTTTPQK